MAHTLRKSALLLGILIFPVLAATANDYTNAPETHWSQPQPMALSIQGEQNTDAFLMTPDEYWIEFRALATSVQGERNIQLATDLTVLDYLNKASYLIRELETNLSGIEIYRQAAEYIQTRYLEEGTSGVTAYHDMLAKVAGEKAEIRQRHRELNMMLDLVRG